VIVTLTPNPSLDRTLEVERLAPGGLNRATRSHVDPGGKGVNVARALVANGYEAAAVVPTGGEEGRYLVALLADLGIDLVEVPIDRPTRENITLAEPDGTVTKVNAPGPPLDREDAERLLERSILAVRERSDRGPAWLVGCGSLPPKAPDDLYARLVEEPDGWQVAVDTSDAPLTAAIAAGPDLVKPNVHELAELVGRGLTDVGDVVDAAQELRAAGTGTVLASLGADGAVLVDAGGTWWAGSPPITPRSSVGAGDAALAGFLAHGATGPEALAAAVAWGAAAASLPGTRMPTRTDIDIDAITVTRDPDPARPLGGGPHDHHR
jgi:1-phosphofructokinase